MGTVTVDRNTVGEETDVFIRITYGGVFDTSPLMHFKVECAPYNPVTLLNPLRHFVVPATLFAPPLQTDVIESDYMTPQTIVSDLVVCPWVFRIFTGVVPTLYAGTWLSIVAVGSLQVDKNTVGEEVDVYIEYDYGG